MQNPGGTGAGACGTWREDMKKGKSVPVIRASESFIILWMKALGPTEAGI